MGAELGLFRPDQRPGAHPKTDMNEDPLHYGPLYEAPPVHEEDYDLDVPDEPSPCENCIFYDSIMCEICIIQDK